MQRSKYIWWLVVALVALAPVGLRAFTWKKTRPQKVDPVMAQAGEELFHHQWKPKDRLTPEGDGLGPVFNAGSCVACHNQGGSGGGGGLDHNVTTFRVTATQPGQSSREGVLHAGSVSRIESLNDLHPQLPAIVRPKLEQLVAWPGSRNRPLMFPAGVRVSQLNTPALFGAKWLDALPDRVIIAAEKSQRVRWGMAPPDTDELPVGRAPRLPDGRIGRFGWKGQTATLSEFVQAACANELGLSNPGAAQARPLFDPNYQARGFDLTTEQCDQITAFVASLDRPRELTDSPPREQAAAGKKLFTAVGCADCHTPDLGSVAGIYSDMLLHRMGQDLVGGGGYYEPVSPAPDTPSGDGPAPSEWRTPPLWGVADSAPYLHDGRADTLEEAIRLHGGQGARSARRFAALGGAEQAQLLAFLKTLRAP